MCVSRYLVNVNYYNVIEIKNKKKATDGRLGMMFSIFRRRSSRNFSSLIRLVEVGPRDGLQNVSYQSKGDAKQL